MQRPARPLSSSPVSNSDVSSSHGSRVSGIRTRAAGWPTLLVPALVLALPALAYAHERWIRHRAKPFDKAYFQSLSGEVLELSLLATLGIASLIATWYMVAVPLRDRVEDLREQGKGGRLAAVLGFFLDAEIDAPFLSRAERVTEELFARIPGLVLMLGVIENWIVMPSFPLRGPLGPVLRVAEGALAAWALSGLFRPALGVALFLVFGWLNIEYGLAAIDAIPVLASAFYYVFHRKGSVGLNGRQLLGIRVSLGVGFFLLGLINKMYLAELFIGVGDSYPKLLEGPRALFPALTRETWCFATALGEMTFGLLLLLGFFDKIANLALAAIFTNFVLTFGWAEIVHVYPVAGFLLLFFHAEPGAVLDGSVFRAHTAYFRLAGRRTSPVVYGLSVLTVAVVAAFALLFAPIAFITEVAPRLGGTSHDHGTHDHGASGHGGAGHAH